MKKVLITGGAGFIGYHLTKLLLKSNYEVIGLDSINAYYDVQLKIDRLSNLGIKGTIPHDFLMKSINSNNYHFIKTDISNNKKIHEIFKQEKFNFVINLAAQAGVRYSLINPQAYIDSNITGFLNILEASKNNNVEHLVYASTSSVYGLNGMLPFNESHPTNHPVSLYAATKSANELMAHSYSHNFSIPTTGLRFFTVYGPWGRPDMALYIFTDHILKGKPIEVYNFGKMKRDFTYVDDIVEGIKRIVNDPATPNPSWSNIRTDPASSSAPYKIYNIGNNHPEELMTFIKEIEKNLGQKADIVYKPMQPGDFPSSHADTAKLAENYSYQPNTSISKGIKNFINWYISYYKV